MLVFKFSVTLFLYIQSSWIKYNIINEYIFFFYKYISPQIKKPIKTCGISLGEYCHFFLSLTLTSWSEWLADQLCQCPNQGSETLVVLNKEHKV